MKELLLYILKGLVDKPKEIKISEEVDSEGRIMLKISADPDDIGKIIGRNGKIIRAIRNLVKIRAIKEKKIVFVEI